MPLILILVRKAVAASDEHDDGSKDLFFFVHDRMLQTAEERLLGAGIEGGTAADGAGFLIIFSG